MNFNVEDVHTEATLLKILIANNFFGPVGGAELSTYTNYQLLKSKGLDVFFFATDRQPYFEPDYPWTSFFPKFVDYDELSGLPDKVKHVPRLFYNTEAEEKLDAFIQEVRPDVIHCGNIYYHLTPSILKAAKRHHVPVVLTLRDARLLCPTGTMMIGTEKYCEQELCMTGSPIHCLTNRCYDKNVLQSALVAAEFQFRRAHQLFDSVTKFVAPSQAMYALAQRGNIPETKLKLLYNFIDDSFFETQPRYDSGDYFLFVGRLSKEKGVHFLLEAFKELPRDIELHIVGEGPEEENLKALAQEYGLPNVRFMGFLMGDDLRDQYHHCLASIVPSYWFEVYGRTIVETFTFGKPVIGSRIGGIEEAIDPGVHGYLFEPGNVEQLRQAIHELHTKPELAIEMGRNARKRSEERYTAQIYGEGLLSLYEELVSSPRPVPITQGAALL